MYQQTSLFDAMPEPIIKTIVDTHPEKSKPKQYSICWCWKCNKTAPMLWIKHGFLKRCSGCGKEYPGWKSLRETDKNGD